MAALKIAFEAPDNSGMFRPSQARPIDLVHLANQTMGDKALEIEVLQMFSRQSRQLMKDIAGADTEGRKSASHRLKGASLAVGAHAVARAAEAIENDPATDSHLAELSVAVLEAEHFVLKLCR
ncbi:HPt (histidine-containing phosphotransfer) domain-containing protein [Rhizobium sp. RU20A]|uniref:Hpt domain-containing protein n=1 Tax=Rhizobium sp. RU20A TaxID=1907412 RepID=UPI00095468D6|nr:Hpt domain-containing protein [Rhizobium sp. RU20A]SIQ13526.1 HPt (histidine-containing phosphotransfer) domain-containing protein [Rhizobium sp. RU20A]